MEPSTTAVRVREAIPTPLRVAGWLLLAAPLLALIVLRPGQTGQLRSLISQALFAFGLGAGIVPLQFLTIAWVVVALLFWIQARSRGYGLGRKSGLVVVAALASQVLLLMVIRAA